MALLDDPQTEESAGSVTQNAAREKIIQSAVLGLAGPGKDIAAIAAVTVIEEDDLSDRLLDRRRHPEWRGFRKKLLVSPPADDELWEEYAEVYRAELRGDKDPGAANRWYKRRRKKLDAGAEVSWPDRYLRPTEDSPGEISGIQHAMNLRISRGEQAFSSEFQNEPKRDTGEDVRILTAEEIASKTSGYKRGVVPAEATALTAFIDVQGKAMYWVVCAWTSEFTGFVVDYGTYPEQTTRYYSLAGMKRTLAKTFKTTSLPSYLYSGLERTCDHILGREWEMDGGGTMTVSRCLIDANWGKSTNTVYKFCRETEYRAVVFPSHGDGVTASRKPLNTAKKKPGERRGLNWQIPRRDPGKREVWHVIYDTNFWKSWVHAGLAAPAGDPTSISLYGRKPDEHRLFADHHVAEYRVVTEGRGRRVDEWQNRPGKPDNHWLDGTVGCCVAASIEKITAAGTEAGDGAQAKRKTADFAAMQQAARSRRR
jgi:hypothetical protein